MEIKSIYQERRTLMTGEAVDAVKMRLTPSEEELQTFGAQAGEGYTELLECWLTLYKPPIDVDEAVQEAVATKDAKLAEIALALPDEIAVQHVDIYPLWAPGIHLEAQARIQHAGGLYRVQQAHTTEHPPGVHTAALYTRILPPDEEEDWQPGQSYDEGVTVRHIGRRWLSMVPNNTYEPGAPGVYDNVWKEIVT